MLRTLERTPALQGKGFALDAVSPAFGRAAPCQAGRFPSASRPSAAEAPHSRRAASRPQRGGLQGGKEIP
jgi:hypothetical protein